MSISTFNRSHNAIDVSFSNHKMTVFFEDGRELFIPIEWFSKLRNATANQLKQWRFIGEGEGIH